MKGTVQPDNFSITISRDTFESLKKSATSKGTGLYRTIKDYLRITVFPFMVHGDYIYIRGLQEHDNSIGVTLHLNYRLLTRVREDIGVV